MVTPLCLMHTLLQIQADFEDGHVNLMRAREVLLTPTHLCLVMEWASGGTLTAYVTDRWDSTDQRGGLFLSEEEARYLTKVIPRSLCLPRSACAICNHLGWRTLQPSTLKRQNPKL